VRTAQTVFVKAIIRSYWNVKRASMTRLILTRTLIWLYKLSYENVRRVISMWMMWWYLCIWIYYNDMFVDRTVFYLMRLTAQRNTTTGRNGETFKRVRDRWKQITNVTAKTKLARRFQIVIVRVRTWLWRIKW